jgi:hypothetical protein
MIEKTCYFRIIIKLFFIYVFFLNSNLTDQLYSDSKVHNTDKSQLFLDQNISNTLERKDPNYDNTLPENWQASRLYGTPGGDINSTPITEAGQEQASQKMPLSCQLLQNYPNTFNPTTAIGYQLSAVSYVNLSVYDMLSQSWYRKNRVPDLTGSKGMQVDSPAGFISTDYKLIRVLYKQGNLAN